MSRCYTFWCELPDLIVAVFPMPVYCALLRSRLRAGEQVFVFGVFALGGVDYQ
jgi:hypothetical protein